jgi:glycosyltransferase involved in cell wall biosynthesis
MTPSLVTVAPSGAVPALLPARSKLPRVLYALMLDPGDKYGSMEEQIVLLAHAFRNDGSLFLPLFICAPEAANVDQFRRRGVQAECLELRRFGAATLWRLWRILRRRRIDAVHWNFVHPVTNAYLWALSLVAPLVRHVFTDHNSRTTQPAPLRGAVKSVKRALLRRYRQVWGVSQFVTDRLAEQGVWSNLVCCRHFINTARFCPDADQRVRQRAALGAADAFVLMFVGQLIAEKGVDVAVRAMAELPPDTVLWIAGAGPQEAGLRQLIAELRLEQRVKLLGLQHNVQPFLQAADVFVCPSRWAEAAGLVNLESQACGLPVVASRIGGIPEYVEDGRSGILFEPSNAQELAAAVRRLHGDRALRERMSRAARAVALERFAPEARLPAILDLYRHT